MKLFECPRCGKIEDDDHNHKAGPTGETCEFPRELWTPLQVGALYSVKAELLKATPQGNA